MLPPPLKWFSIPQCWRYERMTRGRRREHYQWNLDVWGVDGVAAEAELLAAAVGFCERVGLTPAALGVKVSTRGVLAELLSKVGVPAERFAAVAVVVDKLDKLPEEEVRSLLGLMVPAIKVDTTSSLCGLWHAAGVLADRADEARLRDVFASGDAGAIGRLDRYEGLVDFYSTYPGGVAFAAPPAVDSKSTLLYDALEPKAPMGREGSSATVTSMSKVITNFNKLYANVLARLEPVMRYDAPLFIAGPTLAFNAFAAQLCAAPARARDARFVLAYAARLLACVAPVSYTHLRAHET